MRKMLFALSALAALALLAPNSGIAQGANNQVGIYTVQTPDLANLTDDDVSISSATGGQFTAYVVVTNPWNDNTGAAITNLGGFEFRIEWGSLFVTAALAPTATNFQTPPDFYCGSNIPVSNGSVVVATLTIGAFGTDPVPFYITPVSDANSQSIPGAIAITDADDEFSISQAFPSSGDFADPVFGYNTIPVPSEDHSWGEMKALFR